MVGFILLHLPNDSATAGVASRVAGEITFEMFFVLAFRLGEKSQIPPVTNQPCPSPMRRRPGPFPGTLTLSSQGASP